MKPIQAALTSTDGYIKSFSRNTVEGWWEVEIGLPINWVYDENVKIGCEVVFENEVGKLVRVYPKKTDVVLDDLIAFVEIIIATNERIAEKEKQFTDKMQEMKGILEDEAKKFYQELDELKENSFKKNNANFAKTLEVKPKRGRPKGSKTKVEKKEEVTPVMVKTTAPSSTTNPTTNTVTVETETLDSK